MFSPGFFVSVGKSIVNENGEERDKKSFAGTVPKERFTFAFPTQSVTGHPTSLTEHASR